NVSNDYINIDSNGWVRVGADFDNLSPGTFNFNVTVTDLDAQSNFGDKGQRAETFSITVLPDLNQAPVGNGSKSVTINEGLAGNVGNGNAVQNGDVIGNLASLGVFTDDKTPASQLQFSLVSTGAIANALSIESDGD